MRAKLPGTPHRNFTHVVTGAVSAPRERYAAEYSPVSDRWGVVDRTTGLYQLRSDRSGHYASSRRQCDAELLAERMNAAAGAGGAS